MALRSRLGSLLGFLLIGTVLGCGGDDPKLSTGDICDRNAQCESGGCLIVDLTVPGSCKRCASKTCATDADCAATEQCVTPAGAPSYCFFRDPRNEPGCP